MTSEQDNAVCHPKKLPANTAYPRHLMGKLFLPGTPILPRQFVRQGGWLSATLSV